MCEEHLEASISIRVLEADSDVLVTVDGPFESRTFKIPTDDATVLVTAGTLDCRAIVFNSHRGGGRLRALYPVLHGEIQIRYDLRNHLQDSTQRTLAEIVTVDEPMTDHELEQWTSVWEPTTDTTETEEIDARN